MLGSVDHIRRISFTRPARPQDPVEVIRLSTLRERKLDHSVFEPMRLDFHLLQFVVEGRGRHMSDFEELELAKGDVLHTRPGQVHAYDEDSSHEVLLLIFTRDALATAGIPLPPRWQPNTVLQPGPHHFALMLQLLDVLERLDRIPGESHSEDISPYLLGALLSCVAVARRTQQESVDPTARRHEELALRFEEELEGGFTKERNVAAYADRLQVTTRTLSRACAGARGLTPKALIDLRVVLEGKRRLLTSDGTVEAIGSDLGFSEATNFVKYFKRIAGITPEAFRREGAGLAG